MDDFRTASKILTVPAPVDVVLAMLTDPHEPAASRAGLVAFDADTTDLRPGTRMRETRRYRGRTVSRTLTIDAVVPEGYLAAGHIGAVRCRVAVRARPGPAGSTRVMCDLHIEGRDGRAPATTRLVPRPLRPEAVFLALVGRDLVTLGRSAVAATGRGGEPSAGHDRDDLHPGHHHDEDAEDPLERRA